MTNLTADQGRKLILLQGKPTRYEVVLQREKDKAKVLLVYTERPSKAGLCSAVTGGSRASDIVAFLESSDNSRMYGKRGEVFFEIYDNTKLVGTVQLGRTQREAICAGELPFLGNVVRAVRGN